MPHWEGSRVSLKATVRAYLAPCRKNISFLSGLLRKEVLPGALVVLMMAKEHPEFSHAAYEPIYVEETEGANPLASVDVVLYPAPTFS